MVFFGDQGIDYLNNKSIEAFVIYVLEVILLFVYYSSHLVHFESYVLILLWNHVEYTLELADEESFMIPHVLQIIVFKNTQLLLSPFWAILARNTAVVFIKEFHS